MSNVTKADIQELREHCERFEEGGSKRVCDTMRRIADFLSALPATDDGVIVKENDTIFCVSTTGRISESNVEQGVCRLCGCLVFGMGHYHTREAALAASPTPREGQDRDAAGAV